MRLSIVVGAYNMHREIPRTILTMGPHYQRLPPDDYEIILVDNGSPEPISDSSLKEVAPNLDYRYIETASPSPVLAINDAVADSRGDLVMVVIDGARMFSPGLIANSLKASAMYDEPLVYAPSLHLGAQLQNDSSYGGYDQEAEDVLLETVPWRQDGYRLFEVSNVESVVERLALPTFESNCFTVRRGTWDRLGGYLEGFAEAEAGGLANWEIFNRYVQDDAITPVLLFGEATFHQFHGGASTNRPRANHPIRQWLREYEEVTGAPYAWPEYVPVVFGKARAEITEPLYGENVVAQVRLARTLSFADDHGAAVAIARRLCSRHQHDPAKLQLLAEVLERGSRRAEALAAIDSALAIAPTQAELHVTKGVVHVGLDQLTEAGRSYDEAVQLDPLLPIAFFHRAHLRLREDDVPAAIADFERALELEPHPPAEFSDDLVLARARLNEPRPTFRHAPSSKIAPVLDLASIRSTYLRSVLADYSDRLDPKSIEEHAAGGSFSQGDAERFCELIQEIRPSTALVVGAFLGFSTRILYEMTQDLQTSILAIDPNIRHRLFDMPLDHCRGFVRADRVEIVDGFFGARTHGGTLFDLAEFEPRVSGERASQLIAQCPLLLPSSTYDLVVLDADRGAEAELLPHAVNALRSGGTLLMADSGTVALAELVAAFVPTWSAQRIDVEHGRGFVRLNNPDPAQKEPRSETPAS